MTERELIKKLNSLRIVKPAAQWKNSSREILIGQISQGKEIERVSWIFVAKNFLPLQFFSKISQPVWAVVLILLFAAGSTFAGERASRDSKPGDSLYIGKLISERTRATFTFNEKEKVKLNVEFAKNRTEEMKQILDDQNKEQEKKIERLTQDFQKEIKVAKKRLGKMGINEPAVSVETKDKAADNESVSVFGANLGKDERGVEISQGQEIQVPVSEPQVADVNLQNTLNEAEKLFSEKNYSATLDKLNEVNKVIEENLNKEPENNATSTSE